MDAISLLKNDHQTVERLFKRFENTSDSATVERRRIVDEIIKELSVHAEIEETVFYPAVRESVPPSEEMVLESLEEHHVVKWVLSELDGMAPDAERFEAKVTVLIENVRHHVEEEESDLFPKVQLALSSAALDEMGAALARAKSVAPTRPHPRSPDTPPGNIVTGVVAAALDRAREAGQELVENATSAARRNRGGGTKKTGARKAPAKRTAKKKATGSARKTAKSAARSTKASTRKAAGATKRATKRTTKKAAGATKRTTKKAAGATKKAAGTGRRTTKKATGTTKRTAQSATRAAKSATRTAKKATRTAENARRTAKRATRTAEKATRTAKTAGRKTTGRKTTSRPRKAAKKRSS